MIANIAFTTPILLAALAILPILWWLLRAVPPAPIKRRFPGIALLLGLNDDETQTDTTPWWLLLLRMLAVAAFIIGFAGPVLNPEEDRAGSGPLLIAMDGSWASARDWPARTARVEELLAEAAREGRPAAIAVLTDPPAGDLTFQSADTVAATLAGVQPRAWEPNAEKLADWQTRLGTTGFETVWFSDGLSRDSRSDMLAVFEGKGSVTIVETPRPVYALTPAVFQDGRISLTALRSPASAAREITVSAIGPDPNGLETELATASASFSIGATEAEILLDLPTELRNRVNRFEIQGTRSAGAVTLTDDALKRREVGLLAGRNDQEAGDLLSPLYYLNKALVPTADLIEGALQDMLLASPDVLILADMANVSGTERDALLDWVDEGGMLVRFAGPRTAAADLESNDPLMPVRLRAGGRSVGGAMSWGEPKALRAFTRDSPFFGLAIADDVQVTSQVVAQPDPELAARTIASLADGTPLVTRKQLGDGQIILFHVTANAEWSTLPLSGLFVQMLERLAISTRPAEIPAEELAGTTWVPEETLDAFGVVRDAGNLAGVAGEMIAESPIGVDLPPGLYAGEDRRIALNVLSSDAELSRSEWPAGTTVEGIVIAQETPLMGALLSLALALLLVDILASLALSGKLRGAATTALVVMAVFVMPQPSQAQSDDRALEATSEVVLAYVKTGDAQLDRVSDEGLRGLSLSLFRRTSVEPADPLAVDLETDELAFFPILYWPITERQPTPSPQAYAKLNQYLRTGGMILFDTRDGNIGGFGTSTPQGRKLQALAAPLDIPALEPIPQDHVLTRTFYLLQDFPGRFTSRDIWVEAAPADAEAAEGLPFRDLNDGVTPVLIGGNDWAAAWARDERGNPRYPVGRGFGGERQREMAIRFGVNVVMHVLTGNYKSDQVHVPALLERLGN
ncbi:DUF4159 domain-containing protein [Litoreibacter janthinus]|uniref:N-terminal double-transmembrane domain-containing protein n=1 Tax=Litoreibacter janthinus TaxID=670154 RepID=A0A1I6G8P9_9RHOB|nr:DUF4159 domain-containing protein [Litoreibacter janthinus]SFR38520.1 N-terminal double-transmembrane domain-containing protein [Litoreibacter janthinus]